MSCIAAPGRQVSQPKINARMHNQRSETIDRDQCTDAQGGRAEGGGGESDKERGSRRSIGRLQSACCAAARVPLQLLLVSVSFHGQAGVEGWGWGGLLK